MVLGYKFSEESKRKMRLAKLGKPSNRKGKTGGIAWNRGLKTGPLSEEHKLKIKEGNMGKTVSEEVKNKLRIFFKGKSFEERYGTKRAKEIIGKIRLKHIGMKMPLESTIKKKNYKSPIERNIRISNSLKGKPKTEEHIKKASENRMKVLKGRGYCFTEEIKLLMRQKRAKQICPVKDTKIEVKIQMFLKELGYEFFTHQYLNQIEHSYQCDILVPALNLVIECDGDYWHKYPIGTEIDHIRTTELIEKGFKVLRLWECEIKKMNKDEFELRLKKF